MKKTSFIRWKFVLPTSLFLGLVFVFFYFFFDPLLAKAISAGASMANGAKVEVDGLQTKLFRGRLSIQRLQVTDSSNTWINLVEAGPLVFELDPSELFTKRFIIPEASLEGLKFGTPRKSDGRLRRPPKPAKDEKPSAAAKLMEKYKGQFALNFKDMKADAKSKVEFDPKSLNLTKDADALKLKTESLPDAWKSKIDSVQAEERLKKIEATLKEVESGPTKGIEALASAPERLKKLKQAKSDLDSLKTDIKSAKDNFSTDLKSVQSGIAGLKNSKKKDLDDLMSRFNLDFADPKRLVEGMIGDSVLGKVKVALHYADLARKNMPSKKDQEDLPPRPRFKGIDIRFPTPAAPPRFWLKKASLSGEYQAIAAAGSLTHVTSDPGRVGQPLKLDLTGKSAAQPFLLGVVADHTGSISKDSLALKVGNLDLLNFLKGGFLGDSLKQGVGNVEFNLALVENAPLDGSLKLDMKSLKLDESTWLSKAGVVAASTKKEDIFKAQFLKNVARGFETMPAFSVVADIGGTWTDPSLSLRSNAGDMLGKVVKESVGSLVKEQQKELEAKLDGILKEKSSELNQKSAALQDKLNGLFSGLDKDVQEKINKATGMNLSSGSGSPVKIPSLDKLFK